MRTQTAVVDSLLPDDGPRDALRAERRPKEVAVSTEPPFRIPMPPNGKWTEADIDALRDDVPYRTEIIDGALIVSPAARPWHNDVLVELRNALVAALPRQLWAFAHTEIRWVDGDQLRHSLIPDVLVAPRSLRREDECYAPPRLVDLVIEVESPSSLSMDRRLKPQVYAELGIPAMWRLERDLTLVEYRLTPDGGPEIVQTVTGGKFTTEVPFPVTLDLDALR
jgi:Uma2 family endonuclease